MLAIAPHDIDYLSSTVICSFSVDATDDSPSQDPIVPVIELYVENEFNQLSVYFNSSDNGRVLIKKSQKDCLDEWTTTEFFINDGDYFCAILIKDNIGYISFNGFVVGKCELFSKKFDSFMINTGTLYFKGVVVKANLSMVYPKNLQYTSLLSLYKNRFPDNNHSQLEYIEDYFKFIIPNKDALSVFWSCTSNDFFNKVSGYLSEAISKVYEQYPSGSEFTEEMIRDVVYIYMSSIKELDILREEYTKVGRTDLVIKSKSEATNKLRIEFKIHGRRGYEHLPEQPLKYFLNDESAAFVVLIDRRKKTDVDGLRKIVRENKDYKCIELRDLMILPDTDVIQFVSFHEVPRFARPKMITNIYMHIPS